MAYTPSWKDYKSSYFFKQQISTECLIIHFNPELFSESNQWETAGIYRTAYLPVILKGHSQF